MTKPVSVEYQLGKNITPSEGWWWAILPIWKRPILVYMAKLRDDPWECQTMVNIENIDPYMLYKKITEYPMPDKDSKEYIKSHTHFFVNL